MPLIGLLIGVLGGPVVIAAYSAVFGARGGFSAATETETSPVQTPPPDGEKRQEVDDVAG